MVTHNSDPKTLEELMEILTSLIPAGIRGILDRIVAAHPDLIDPTIEMVEGSPQPIYKANIDNMVMLAIGEFLAYSFGSDLSTLPAQQAE